jgi:ABC-type glycerol-3-phosphate transport system substrate-binding protein
MQNPAASRNRSRFRASAALALVAALAIAGCSKSSNSSTGKYGFKEAKQSSTDGITVWIDATRQPAVDAYKKANPNDKITVVTYDGSANGTGSFKTKMNLYDKAGSGWPDVVFSTQNNDASWASQSIGGKQAFAATLDQGLIPSDTLSGFAKGALDPCTVGGKVYCLRNDLAQDVLWYNKTLMDQFGYTVPKTWEDYQALGDKVAADHPGYIIGAAGDTFTEEIYMWSSKCEANDVTGARAIKVDTSSDGCKKMADLLDKEIANKSITTDSVFTPEFVKAYTGKVLMMPGPAWYAGAIFNNKDSLNVPSGQIGVAAPLAWGSDAPVTGDVGGATWFISSHSTNLALAAKFVEFVTTADDYQVNEAPGYPAFASAGQKWIAKQQSSGYYATDLSAITTAGGQIWSGWGAPTFSQEAIWGKTMTPVITSGGSIASNLAKWQTAITDQAKVDGYTVS